MANGVGGPAVDFTFYRDGTPTWQFSHKSIVEKLAKVFPSDVGAAKERRGTMEEFSFVS